MHPSDDELVCTPIQHNGNTTLNLEDVRSFTSPFCYSYCHEVSTFIEWYIYVVLSYWYEVKFFIINREILLTAFSDSNIPVTVRSANTYTIKITRMFILLSWKIHILRSRSPKDLIKFNYQHRIVICTFTQDKIFCKKNAYP